MYYNVFYLRFQIIKVRNSTGKTGTTDRETNDLNVRIGNRGEKINIQNQLIIAKSWGELWGGVAY